MKKIYFAIIGIVSLCACNNKSDIKQFDWLIGKWEGKMDSIHLFEEWSRDANQNLSGRAGGYVLNDTFFYENIKITEKDESFFYSVTPNEAEETVDFKFTGIINDTTIFENPAHDFPQRICYYKNADGSLYAKIDGKQMGNYSREEFFFQKVK